MTKTEYIYTILFVVVLAFIAKAEEKTSISTLYPPSIMMDEQYDTFDLYLWDGGAFGYLSSVLPEVSGKEILESYKKGELLSEFKSDGKIVWDKFFNVNSHPRIRKQLEKHVWLNRLYFLLPMALEFYRTGEEYWAKEFMHNFKSWVSENPYPYFQKFNYERGNYIWYDMQVCWRFLVLAHSIPLLEISEAISFSDRELLKKMLGLHGSHIQKEVLHGFEVNKAKGNHFLQKGLVLLMACLEYQKLFQDSDWFELAMKVIMHIDEKETLKDGANIEGSPSYSHFIARMYLDCFLILKKHNREIPKFLEKTLEKQYSYLGKSIAPDDMSLPFGDSYHLNVRKDLELVEKLTGLSIPFKSESSFQSVPSRFVCLKKGKLSVYVNGFSPGIYSHLHGGAPNLVAYFDKQPIIWEAGMCNYDDDFIAWNRSFDSHSSVSIQPIEGKQITWRDYRKSPPKIDIVEFDPKQARVKYTFHYQANSKEIKWTREIQLEEKKVVVNDSIVTNFEATFNQNFHAYKGNSYLDTKANQVYVANPSIQLRFHHLKKDRFSTRKNPLRDISNQSFMGTMVQRSTAGKTANFTTFIDIEPL